MSKSRKELIEELEYMQSHIEHYLRIMGQKVPHYYSDFGHMDKWFHNLEIWDKCLHYWKRRFNRTLTEIQYTNVKQK
jgi:hypothetical protein